MLGNLQGGRCNLRGSIGGEDFGLFYSYQLLDETSLRARGFGIGRIYEIQLDNFLVDFTHGTFRATFITNLHQLVII